MDRVKVINPANCFYNRVGRVTGYTRDFGIRVAFEDGKEIIFNFVDVERYCDTQIPGNTKILEVKRFKTSDGTLFKEKSAAISHQEKLDSKNNNGLTNEDDMD